MAVKKFLKDAEKLQQQHLQRKGDESQPHAAGGHDESNWLVSYADMMTLLCAFFIMLFSMAKMDNTQYETVKKELAEKFGGKYEAPPSSELAKFLSQVIQEAGIAKETMIKSDPSGVSISFQSTVFFDTLSADVRPQGRIVLDKLIQAVWGQQSSSAEPYRVVVEGHTDSRPIIGGAFPSNWELSGARAARVVRMFIDKGFRPERLTGIGYGDTRPVGESRAPDGSWDEELLAKNRRVVVRILEPGVDSIPYPEQAKPAEASRLPASSSAPVPATPPVAQAQPANPVTSAH